MKVVLVCIAKNEDNYIEEWLDYNKKLGFDEIIMYQNDWRCDVNRPFLTKIEFDGICKQMEAYNHFLNIFRKNYDYVAFLDCDEFIVLKKHNNIKEFLSEYDNPYGIGINWQFFGSNGKINKENNSLLKQFTFRQKNVNQHIKCFLKTSSNSYMVLPHNPNTPLMDTNRKYFQGPFNDNGPVDIISINHYHHKTFEDWLIRCKRGRADMVNEFAKIEQWENDKFLNCDVEDLTAHDFMYKK
jgi:hypothetical protein